MVTVISVGWLASDSRHLHPDTPSLTHLLGHRFMSIVLTIGLGVIPSARQSKPLITVWHDMTLCQEVVGKLNCNILLKPWPLLQLPEITEHITDQSKVFSGLNIVSDRFVHR